LGKCSKCVTLLTQIENSTNSKEKDLLKIERKSHIDFVIKQRSLYYDRRELGIAKKGEYVSLIIDGMDQKKTELPQFYYETKQNTAKLKIHVVGIIVHGVKTYGYFHTPEFLCDSNITIECLSRTILDLGLEYFHGKTLYIQMDNTCKDNKNERLHFFLYLIMSSLF